MESNERNLCHDSCSTWEKSPTYPVSANSHIFHPGKTAPLPRKIVWTVLSQSVHLDAQIGIHANHPTLEKKKKKKFSFQFSTFPNPQEAGRKKKQQK